MAVKISNPKENENLDQSRVIDGIIVASVNDATYGNIMFETTTDLTESFARRKTFIRTDTVENLKKIVKTCKLVAGAIVKDPGTGEDFKIITKESFKPSFEGHAPKINPKSGNKLLKEKKYIYASNKMVLVSSIETDELIEHDAEEDSTGSKAVENEKNAVFSGEKQ